VSQTAAAHRIDLVPLADRLRYMQLFRLTVSAVAVLFAGLAPDLFSDLRFSQVAAGTGAFLLATLASEGLARLGWQRALFGGMLIVDGIYLAWLSYATGGIASPFRYLVILHLVAVVLLASYRTGLKLAIWHSLLLFVVFHAQEAGLLETPRGVAGLPGSDYEQLMAFAAVFWLVTIATACFSSINERELRRRRFDLEALAGMAAELEGAVDSLSVADVLLENVTDAFGFERALLFSPADGEFELMAARGCGPVAPDTRPGHASALARAAETRETQFVSELDPAGDPELLSMLPSARNLVVLPLVAETGCAAVLVVEHGLRADSRIERRVVSMLERFVSHAALALLNAQLLEHVQKLADLDGLTAVANRRTFETVLERELSRARRIDGEVGLVLVDVDRFKDLNDTEGHQAGDELLRRLGRLLLEDSRDFDTAARYGGDEFALVLPGSSVDDALQVAERIRRRLGESDGSVPATLSIGVASFPLHATDSSSLVQAADEALYESKRGGRDRVTASSRRGGSLQAVGA
jgi:two-component system, cell cycle response regulator